METWEIEMKQPNVLVIITDDHRHDALGCAGNRLAVTPNLDALAAKGVRFTQAIATTAIWRASVVWDGGSISSTRLNISSIISPPSWSGVTRIITPTL